MNNEKLKFYLNKIKLSHVMCVCSGALVPMFADTFFLHEINSSTVSAVMDTIMAIAAIYAAFSVKDWLDSKISDKAFEEANLCITYVMDAKIKASEIFENIESMYNYLGTTNILIYDPNYININKKNMELLAEYETHLTKLNERIALMKVWGLEIIPDRKKEFNKFITNYIVFLEHSQKMLNVVSNVNGMARKKDYEFYFLDYNTHFTLTQILPAMLLTSWKGLFQVSKSSTANHDQ